MVSNSVRQLIAAADERKSLLCSTANPLYTGYTNVFTNTYGIVTTNIYSDYIEVTNAWISAYIQLFPGSTNTVSTNSYSNATQGAWTAIVTNYYLNVSNMVFTNEARADKVSALLKTIDALTILFLASKNVADLGKQVGGKFDNYCTPYITTNGTWNTNGYWVLSIVTNEGLAPPVHTINTYANYLSSNTFDGAAMLTNFSVAYSETTYSNNIEGWTIGEMNTRYVPSVGVSTSYTDWTAVLACTKQFVKPFQLGQATYGVYNWKWNSKYSYSEYTYPDCWPTWVKGPINVGTLVFTGFQEVIVYGTTNEWPLYCGIIDGTVVTSLPPESVCTTNPPTLSNWNAICLFGNRSDLNLPARLYLFLGSWQSEWIGLEKITNGYVQINNSTHSDEWVLPLGWRYTHLNDAWVFSTYELPFLITTNGYLPTRVEYQDGGNTNYPLSFPPNSELVMINRRHQTNYVAANWYTSCRMSVGTFTNMLSYSGENLLLTNSFIGLDQVVISNMNVLVTNTIGGKYTNAYLQRGATITFWASNTYDIYDTLTRTPTGYAPQDRSVLARLQTPCQLNARYYMLKNLNGTWELPAMRNEYLSRTVFSFGSNQPWGEGYSAPETTNDVLNHVGWFVSQEIIGPPLISGCTNLIEYSLSGSGLAAPTYGPSAVDDGITAWESSSMWDGMSIGMARYGDTTGELWHSFDRLGEEHAYLHVASKIKGKTGELYRKSGTEKITINNIVSNRPLQGYQQFNVVNLPSPIVDTNFPFYSYQRPNTPYTYRYEPLNGQDLGVGDSEGSDYWDESLSDEDFTPWEWYWDYNQVEGKKRSMNYRYQKGQNAYKALVYWDFEY